ncbi:MAG: hypothetical protein ACHQJ5_07880 [Vicinamibacteria bacterium]|jgi:hypothetical protein
MERSERIRRHLRGNVVGYVAVFIALSGTAAALPGQKTVKSDDIAKGAVKGKALAADAVSTSKLRANSVSASKIAAAAVTASKLGGSAVGTGALADAAVTAPKLATDSVVREKIGQGEINGGKLANGSVNSAKVADGTLLAEDFAAGQLSDGFVLSGSGPFTIQRAGRVFVTATVISTCAATPCNDVYGVEVDDVAVPAATLTRPDQAGAQQLTMIGITPSLAAGAHTIELTQTQIGSTESQLALGGILLQ